MCEIRCKTLAFVLKNVSISRNVNTNLPPPPHTNRHTMEKLVKTKQEEKILKYKATASRVVSV